MGLITTDLEFWSNLGDNYTVSCWSLPYVITLEKSTISEYFVSFKDVFGNEIFENDKGAYFQIRFDSAQRFVSLYFFNGIRGWYLDKEDVWDDINSPISKLLYSKFLLMRRVFDSIIKGTSTEDELADENTKHFYNIKPTSDKNVNEIYLTPKKVWYSYHTFSNLNQPDYKVLEEKGVEFIRPGIGKFDVSIFQNIDTFLTVRGYKKEQSFVDYTDELNLEEYLKEDCFDNLSPSEYYYTIDDIDKRILIVPKKYYDKTNELCDKEFHPSYEELLVGTSIGNGVWNFKDNSTSEEIKNDFDALGYVFNSSINF